MKTNLNLLVVLPLAFLLTNCKKSSDLQPSQQLNENNYSVNAAATTVAANTVTTIAGGNSGYQDGTGANARFSLPWGIQYATDGNIYVADRNNNKLRKVTPAGVVTTLDVPKAGAFPLKDPQYVAISKTGIVNVIDVSEQGASENRVYKPDGTLDLAIAPWYAVYGILAKDPYGDFFWTAQGGFPLKFLIAPDHGWIGIDQPAMTSGDLEYPEAQPDRYKNLSGLAVGYNNVIYFAYGNHLYKLLRNGHFERIYKDLNLGRITSIILNKDSRTIYIAADGYIKRIDLGKLTTVAGPNGSNPGKDGVGREANVYAQSLAMGKTENEIYFTDIHVNAIRKITFK
jgi:hypothetical protein